MDSNKNIRLLLLSLFLPMLCTYSSLKFIEGTEKVNKLEIVREIDNLMGEKYSENEGADLLFEGNFKQNSGMIEVEFDPNSNLIIISKINNDQVVINTHDVDKSEINL